MEGNLVLKEGVVRSKGVKDFLGALRLADERKSRLATLPEISAAMMYEKRSWEEISGRYITGSFHSYLGAGRMFKRGRDVKDTYGYGDGRSIILDGDSIPKEVEGVKSALLYFPQIEITQVTIKDDKILFTLDSESAKIFSPFPQKSGPSDLLTSLTGQIEQYYRYRDGRANRVGPFVRGAVITREYVSLDDAPGERRFGMAFVRKV